MDEEAFVNEKSSGGYDGYRSDNHCSEIQIRALFLHASFRLCKLSLPASTCQSCPYPENTAVPFD